MRPILSLILILFTLPVLAGDLEQAYQSLFNLSVTTRPDVVGDALSTKMLEKRDLLFKRVKADPGLQFLFAPFMDLNTFLTYEKVQALAAATKTPLEVELLVRTELLYLRWSLCESEEPTTLSALSPIVQQQFFQNLLQSRVSVLRRIARSIRGLHLDAVYGAELSYVLAGLSFPSVVAPAPLPRPHFSTYLTYDQTSRTLEGDIDYIVVGSGSSGSIVPAELKRAGKKVLVLEKGSLFLNGSFESRLIPEFMDSRTTLDGSVRILTGNALGGGSAVNGDIIERLTDPLLMARFKAWRRQGLIPKGVWEPKALLAADRWVAHHLSTRQYDERDLTTTADLMRKGAMALGNAGKVRFYSANTYADETAPFTITNKINAADRLLIPAILDAQNPVTFLPDAKVTKLLLAEDGVTATGVEFEVLAGWNNPHLIRDPYALGIPAGTRVRVSAKKVVLCAGPLGTTAILKNSGINNPNIGHGLVIHPTTMIHGIFDQKIGMNEIHGSPVMKLDYRKKDFAAIDGNFLLIAPRIMPSTVVQNLSGSPEAIFQIMRDYSRMQTIFMGIFEDRNLKNRVIVDANGAPQVEYAMTKRDRKRFAYMTSEAAKTLIAAGAKYVVVSSNEDFNGPGTHKNLATRYITTLEEAESIKHNLKVIPNQTTIMGLHVISGNVMGTSPANSVVNGKYEVWGTQNLFVADSSVFPATTGTHPMQSIYAIAKIFSDQQVSKP